MKFTLIFKQKTLPNCKIRQSLIYNAVIVLNRKFTFGVCLPPRQVGINQAGLGVKLNFSKLQP